MLTARNRFDDPLGYQTVDVVDAQSERQAAVRVATLIVAANLAGLAALIVVSN